MTLNGFNLGNTFSVAVFTYVRAKPGVNNLTHLAACYGFTSESENVGIVVFSGIARYRDRVTSSGTNARNLISSDCATNTSSVDDNSNINRSISHCPSNCMRKVGIVDGVLRIGTKVVNAVTRFS